MRDACGCSERIFIDPFTLESIPALTTSIDLRVNLFLGLEFNDLRLGRFIKRFVFYYYSAYTNVNIIRYIS